MDKSGVTAFIQCKYDSVGRSSYRFNHHIAHCVDQANIDIALQWFSIDDDAVNLVDAADHAGGLA